MPLAHAACGVLRGRALSPPRPRPARRGVLDRTEQAPSAVRVQVAVLNALGLSGRLPPTAALPAAENARLLRWMVRRARARTGHAFGRGRALRPCRACRCGPGLRAPWRDCAPALRLAHAHDSAASGSRRSRRSGLAAVPAALTPSPAPSAVPPLPLPLPLPWLQEALCEVDKTGARPFPPRRAPRRHCGGAFPGVDSIERSVQLARIERITQRRAVLAYSLAVLVCSRQTDGPTGFRDVPTSARRRD